MRNLRGAIGSYLGTLGLLRAAFARFLEEREIDPEVAVEHLIEVLDSPQGRVGTSFSIDGENPTLARAIRSVPECLDMERALVHADDALNAATRLVRS
jgi:hypothetical protein